MNKEIRFCTILIKNLLRFKKRSIFLFICDFKNVPWNFQTNFNYCYNQTNAFWLSSFNYNFKCLFDIINCAIWIVTLDYCLIILQIRLGFAIFRLSLICGEGGEVINRFNALLYLSWIITAINVVNQKKHNKLDINYYKLFVNKHLSVNHFDPTYFVEKKNYVMDFIFECAKILRCLRQNW